MKIPKTERELIDFARDTIELCTYSQSSRANEAAINLAYYENGAAQGQSVHNRTGVHIERTASYLYAPGEIRFSIGFDATEGEPWLARARAGSKYLSREYRRADADVLFSQGVQVGLVKGCSLMKHNWMDADSLHPGFDPHIVHPEFFGVEREDLARLEDQQALVHTTYLTKDQISQIIEDRQDEKEIKTKLQTIGKQIDDQPQRQNWLHQVVIGGLKPVQTTSTGAKGQVAVSASARTE